MTWEEISKELFEEKTEKRFKIIIGEFEEENIMDAVKKIEITEISDMCTQMNALHEDLETHKQYCKTLGLGINKIMQSIKDDRENKALVMCLTLLKKLEEEELLE